MIILFSLTLVAKDNQKLSKRLCKGFERSVYWSEYNTKNDNKIMINKYRYFLKSKFVWFNRLFWFIETEVTMQKGIKFKNIIYIKVSSRVLASP